MTHIAVGRVLVGAVPPATEKEHDGANINALWLDTNTLTVKICTPENPDGIAIGQGLVDQLSAQDAKMTDLLTRVAALEAKTASTGGSP